MPRHHVNKGGDAVAALIVCRLLKNFLPHEACGLHGGPN